MKYKINVIFVIAYFVWYASMAQASCFIAVENNAIVAQDGDCSLRHSPCSTFKIAISCMGYNEGLLIDELFPVLEFQQGYLDTFESWKQSHNPSLWMKNSCVWYSQVITKILGMVTFEKYVALFSYGNQDLSGDINKNNGLTHAWLSSSLKISAAEQVVFLQKLIENQLPVSLQSHDTTKRLLLIEEFADGWQLYGKTGSGWLLNKEQTQRTNQRIGWFVGWIEKDDRIIVFVQYVQDDDYQESYASIRARASAQQKLMKLLKA